MNHTKKWRSALSLLLALLMVAGQFGGVFASEAEEEKTLTYVSFGDSMTNGYGLPGYEYAKGGNVNGFLRYVEASYPYQFARKLEEIHGVDVNQVPLAISAMRAEDLHFILEFPIDDQEAINIATGGWNEEAWNNKFAVGDRYTWDEFSDGRFNDFISCANNGRFNNQDYRDGINYAPYGKELSIEELSGVNNVAKIYQEATANADVISIGSGNANFGVFMLGRITNAVGFSDGDDSWIDIDRAISECDEKTQAYIKEYIAKFEELAANFDLPLPDEAVEKILTAIEYTVVSYMLNYAGVIDAILELNDKENLEIMLVGLMNTMSGLQIDLGNGELFDFGGFMNDAIGLMNTYIAGLPTVMQAIGNPRYAGVTFYYAEATEVDMIANGMYESYLKNYDSENDAEDVLHFYEENILRDRIITELVGEGYNDAGYPSGMAFGLLGGMISNMIPGVQLKVIDREIVQEYENAARTAEGLISFIGKYGADGSNIAVSCALYLAFEKATVMGSQEEVLSLGSLMRLASGFDGVFDGVMVNMDLSPSAEQYMDICATIAAMLTAGLSDFEGLIALEAADFGIEGFECDIEVTAEMVMAAHSDKDNGIDGLIKALVDPIANDLTDIAFPMMQAQDPEVTRESVLAGFVGKFDEMIAQYEVKDTLSGAIGQIDSLCMLMGIPEGMSKALIEDDIVIGLLSLLARMLVGNGIGCHPSVKGHVTLSNAVNTSYEEGYTALDKVEDGAIHPALDELKKYYLENSSEINDQIYNYLLNNPKEVIAFIEENQGNTERQMAAIAVLAYMYNYYGGQEAVDALLADPAGTFDMFVDLMMTHGDNAYRLIKTYILAAELEEEDYANAFKFLVEMLKEYGPGIAQGIYDWADEQGYIAEIEKAVEEFTGLVEDDVKEFIKVVQPKIEKAVKDLKNFVAEKKAEIAELKTKIETEILPKIEELKAEYAEKKAQYDVIMAHIDEYHPEEKAAVIAAIEAEIKALEEEIKANEAINNQVNEAIANISTEIADVEKLIAQLNGKLDEVGTELEKLAVISADLIKAVEKLTKVAIENIDEEAVEAEIMAVLNDLQTAADEMLYTLKEAWTFTELFTGIAASAEKLGNSLLAKAEKYEEVIGDEVNDVITELTKLLDGSTPEATETIKEIIADVKEIGGISEELAEEIADVAETVITEAGKLADVIAEELKAAVEKAYTNAVTGEYAYSADSYYVNIGDSITKGSNNYAKKLANELGLESDFVDLGNAEYRTEDIRYILDENYTPDAYGKAVVKNVEALRKQYITEIEKADIITVGVGNLTPFMMTQVGKDIFGDEYEMDWAKLVGEDHVQYIEMALDEVKAFISQQELPEIPYKDIIDRFVKIDVEELVMTAVESYAYAYVGFSFNYAELVNDIHEINPDAEVVLVGAYNALPTLAVEGIELGEYIDSLVELMDLQFTVYGMITPNTTFVEVNDVAVERPVEDMMDLVLSIAAPELPSLVATLIGAKEAEINPSEAGHEYIKTEILDAISVTYYGLGDVNLDGEVDAKDATQILRYINGKTSVFDTQNKYKAELIRHNADVDYNVGIEAKDATQILRYCNGKTNTIEGRQ